MAVEELAIPYRIVRSARRRRTLELRVEHDGVRVAAPLRTSAEEIAAFVRSRAGWIQKQIEKTPPSTPGMDLAAGATLPYLGRWLPVECVERAGAGAGTRVTRDLLGIRVTHPPLPEHTRGDALTGALRAWYRERAAEELPPRVAAWGARAGYAAQRVLVRDQKRRWGSCGRDGTIRLNWRLVMLDPAVVDYVVVHEIAHLRHAHHQAAFWAEVERLLPDYRERRRALRDAGGKLPL